MIFQVFWGSWGPGALSIGFSISKSPPGLNLDLLGYLGTPFITQKPFSKFSTFEVARFLLYPKNIFWGLYFKGRTGTQSSFKVESQKDVFWIK